MLTPEQSRVWIEAVRDRAKEMSVGDQLNLMTMHPVKMVALCDMALASLEAAPSRGEAERIKLLSNGLATLAMFVALNHPEVREDFERRGLKDVIFENDNAPEQATIAQVVAVAFGVAEAQPLEAAKQGEAFQCPACGAAIKAPQPPASQGGVIEAAWREAAQFALGRFGALGKDNIGVGVENTVSNLRARKQHQAALAPSVKEKP